MIRRFVNGYEHYECSRCGEETCEDADYCQVCGRHFGAIQDEEMLEDTASDDETICIVVGPQKSGVFTFAQLKKNRTPAMLREKYIMMAEPNPYEFYVFNTLKYPHLSHGSQVNLNLEYYDKFRTENGYAIYYDRRDFDSIDVNELKTYKFNS